MNLLSLSLHRRVRVRVQVPEADPVVPSLYDLYPGVDAMEREAFDMVGIVFSGHPDLTRILMPEDWEGHPCARTTAWGGCRCSSKRRRDRDDAVDHPLRAPVMSDDLFFPASAPSWKAGRPPKGPRNSPAAPTPTRPSSGERWVPSCGFPKGPVSTWATSTSSGATTRR